MSRINKKWVFRNEKKMVIESNSCLDKEGIKLNLEYSQNEIC
jgi:hypothetical protein